MEKKEDYKWYIINVPMRKEEFFCKNISETIKELEFKDVGPCILPTNSFLKTDSGEIKEQTDKLKGFIFIKTKIITNEDGVKIPTDELQKLLNNFPKLKVIYNEPLDEKEINDLLNKSNNNKKNKITKGFAKGCSILKIVKQENDFLLAEIIAFGRKVMIQLRKDEII